MVRAIAVLGFVGTLCATPIAAASYKFTMHNDSEYHVTGFQTYEDGKWSTWSGVDVGPGESQVMDWNSNEGNCTVPFRIIYKDVETEQYKVDWCTIKNVRVHNDRVTVD